MSISVDAALELLHIQWSLELNEISPWQNFKEIHFSSEILKTVALY